MNHRVASCFVCLAVAFFLSPHASAQTLGLPPRAPGALSGSEFARAIEDLGLDARDERIVSEILQGNVPGWLRALRPARVGNAGETRDVEVWVTSDYLAVGSASDYLLVPMTPQAAQRIADELEMSLPTPALVDAIWADAELKMTPQPIAPSADMTTVPVFLRHSDQVRLQRRVASTPMGELVSGHKKDVVVSGALGDNPGRVAIYGWHKLDGDPIQPLYLGHTDRWVDYSHGIRLVSRTISVDGESMDLWTALRDPALATLLSGDGIVERAWYAWR